MSIGGGKASGGGKGGGRTIVSPTGRYGTTTAVYIPKQSGVPAVTHNVIVPEHLK
jgi:hypothetical protein